MSNDLGFSSFANFSGLDKLQFAVGNSPEELLSMLKKLRLETQIISIYGSGNNHVAWFYTNAKVTRGEAPKKKKG